MSATRERGAHGGPEGLVPTILGVVGFGLAALSIPGSRDFALDDAWIHVAYAISLRAGDGLSYNPGDWELGCSSPLWALLLAVWPIAGEPLVPIKLLGALLHGVGAALAAWLVLQIARERATLARPLPVAALAALAGALVATAPTLRMAATSGMEVPLAVAVWLAAVAAAHAGRTRAALALGWAAELARPEAVLVLVPYAATVAGLAWIHRSGPGVADPGRTPRVWGAAAAALGSALGLATWLVYDQLVAGQWWPNPQLIKGRGGGLAGLTYLADEVLPWQPWLVALTGVVLLALATRADLRERRGDAVALIVAASVGWLAIAVSRPLHPGVGFYEARYFAPVSALWCIALPLGLIGLRTRAATLMLAPLAIVTGLQAHALADVARELEDDTARLHSDVARWAAANLPRDAVVAVEGAGASRTRLPRTVTVVDLVGLNDRVAAALHFDRVGKLCHVIGRGPTHMILPDHWVPLFGEALTLTPLQRFDDPSWSQVQPPRPATTWVLEVGAPTPAWAGRCAERAQLSRVDAGG